MRVADLKVGLLLYFVGEENIYAVLLDQEGHAQRFRLMNCKRAFTLIDKLFEVAEENYCTSKKVTSVFHDFSFKWGKELLPPSEYLRPFTILVIIPHHSLHSLPFHTIWLEEEKQFLATSHGVTYCSSGTLFTRCVDRNVIRKSDLSSWEFALEEGDTIAGPKPPEYCRGVGVDVKADQTQIYHHLAEVFAQYFDKAYSPYPHSTEDGSGIVHPRTVIKYRFGKEGWGGSWETMCIVCHGYYDTVLPNNSGLLLETVKGGLLYQPPILLHHGIPYRFIDLPFKTFPVEIEARPECEAELMTVSELKVNCHTDAQLVALFGCSTGAGSVISGDDFGSMAYQWLKLGAVSVLANLWKANVEFIQQWSLVFLENWLKKRQPKAIAWQQALKTILDQGQALEPYQWGVIVLLGDWL